MKNGLAPAHAALQHGRAPRPLPLFLHHVANVAQHDPSLARSALAGLAAYEVAPQPPERRPRPELARVGAVTVRDCGGDGRPVLLVPSLINPPDILDLDQDRSFAMSMASAGNHVLLLDWGPANERRGQSVAGHVEDFLVPLITRIGEPVALLGYCLGGTMAVAAAALTPVRRLATIAAPWHFSAYSDAARASLTSLFRDSHGSATSLGALPMEVLQQAFWSLDPFALVSKFAAFGALDRGSADARRFVALEEWANTGEPVPLPAGRELVEDLFGANVTGRGEWLVARKRIECAATVPSLHLTASADRIAPAAAAPDGERINASSGHVGLIIGRAARTSLHPMLGRWLGQG